MTEDTQLAFDAEEVCRWYDNDLEAIQELIGLVQTDLPHYVENLEMAAEAGNLPEVARVAHTIRGAVGNVCALRLCGVTEALELGARGGDVARVAALRPEFRVTADALLTELAAWCRSFRPSTSASGPGTLP